MTDLIEILKVFKRFKIKINITMSLILIFGVLALITEIIGLSLIIPITDFILNKELANEFFIKIITSLKLDYLIENNINFFVISILLIFIIKFFIVNFNNFLIFWETKRIRDKLSTVAIETFLQDDYLNYLNETSSRFIKKINSDVVHFTNVYISNLLLILEIILVIFVSIFLLNLNFKITIYLFVFFILIMSLYYFFVRSIIYDIGVERSKSEESILRQLDIVFNFFREIKILNKEKIFSFFLNSEISNQTKKIHIFSYINSLTRPLVELIFILSIFGILFFLISNNTDNTNNFLTYFTVLLASIVRVMPSINRIIQLVNSINYSKYSINELKKTFLISKKELSKNKTISKLFFKKSIKLNKILFNFKNSDEKLLNNFNLIIKKNTCVIIHGSSGVGKSTILNLLSGLIQPSKGSLIVDDKKINEKNILSWQKNISIVSQNYFMFNDTIKKNIIGLSNKSFDKRLFKQAIELSQIKNSFSLKKINNFLIGENGSKLSGGQNQRVSIARAIYLNREVLLMDEPTSMLDKKNKQRMISTIKKLKKTKTLIIVSHDKDLIKIADKSIEIKAKYFKK